MKVGTVTITGRLLDVDTFADIEQTPIYLNGVIAAVTDEDGRYTINVPPGEYRLEIRPREFHYLIRDVVVTSDGRIIDKLTGKPVKKTLQLVRATL